MISHRTPARDFAPGIGQAVADRTISRKLPNGTRESWAHVAERVATGNTMLGPYGTVDDEFHKMNHHLRQASLLMSGRHLQHGDASQPTRNAEVFTNCSTSASSFIGFYLLLNGSGVGRAYDDDMMLVDWCKNMPHVSCAIRDDHPDVLSGEIDANFAHHGDPVPDGLRRDTIVFEVPDSREGWAKAVERIETLTYEGAHAHKLLLLDFSQVRHRGQPIGGMQSRPASGPGPLMSAIRQIAALKGKGFAPWKATMHVDHYLAECVLVGGARRAARMATKTWTDESTIEFVSIKKGGVLWSSNNSVTVDEEFWLYAKDQSLCGDDFIRNGWKIVHAQKLFDAICSASYHDGTGEPGLINVDKLTQKDEGIDALFDGNYAESFRFKLDDDTRAMTAELAKVFSRKGYNMITNPCGEIALAMLGGYCVIADVVPFHAQSDDDAEDAFRTATRALMRVNLMDSLYGKEVKRTNRIGVGFTGLHEYAWARFGIGFREMIDLRNPDAREFWAMMARFSNAVVDEAHSYAAVLGVAVPHTALTVKPAGTTSKLFGLTEGAHLPSMREYLRWVQFRNDDPLIADYRAKGYPVRELKSYSGTTIVGFPTVPVICGLGMGDKLVTAAEATPEEQYLYLQLLERFWLHGEVKISGGRQDHDFANQVSYTLKYDPKVVSFEAFKQTLLEGQSQVKCCSVMPQADTTAYEYQPEQPVTREEFEAIISAIDDPVMKQDIGFEHVDCANGACPVDFSREA